MASNESFDELEQNITRQFEEALGEVREEFLARLESTRAQLDEAVAAAREQAASAASVEFEEARAAAVAEAIENKEAEFAEILAAKDAAIAQAEEAKAAFIAEAEEAKQIAIAEAIEIREAEFKALLEAKEAEFAEMLSAAEAAIGEAEEARNGFMAEAEEAQAAAIAAALEAKESEFNELLAAKDALLAEVEQAKESALAEAEETRARLMEEAEQAKEAAVAEARVAAEEALTETLDSTLRGLHQRIARIDAARTQTEALEALLAGTAGYASRGLLLLTREDGLQGWGGRGFETEQGRLQEAHLDYDEGTAWSELAEGRGTIELSDEACEALCQIIDGSRPREGVLIPMVLRDRLAAALYADRLEAEDPFDLFTLQLLAYVAGQALETLPMRSRSATATLRLVTDAPAEEPGLELWKFLVPADEPLVEEMPPERMEEPAAVADEAEAMHVEAESTAETWEAPREVPEPEPEPADLTAAEETGFEVEEVEAPEPQPTVTAEVETPPTEVAAPVEMAAATTQVAPPVAAGAEVAPPEDVDGPGWAFTTRRFDSDSGEDATHEEARRLARLLVTEIKLYNEEQVEEGRRGRNIYRTLKDDIDRSRQIYEERVDEAVRSDTDYFRDELVKILAAGDNEVMGL